MRRIKTQTHFRTLICIDKSRTKFVFFSLQWISMSPQTTEGQKVKEMLLPTLFCCRCQPEGLPSSSARCCKTFISMCPTHSLLPFKLTPVFHQQHLEIKVLKMSAKQLGTYHLISYFLNASLPLISPAVFVPKLPPASPLL